MISKKKKKKKKRSSPKFRAIFHPISQVQTFEGGLFSYGGGYFPFFTENRPQKHKKHAFLHTSQANGGARAPPAPPLATLLPEPNFPANLEKLSQLSATEATHSLSSDSCESSSLTAIEELFNVVSKEQTATTNANNKLHFGVDAPVFSDSLSSEEDSKPISELLKIKTSKGTWQTKIKKKRKYKSRESNSPSGLTPPNKIEHKQFTNPNEKTFLNK